MGESALVRGARWGRCAALGACIWLAGCSSQGGGARTLHQLGERVQVGPLVYTVLEAEWLEEINHDGKSRVPQKRFLLLRMSVTNAGNREVSLPMFQVEDARKAAHLELNEGAGVEDWMGILRAVGPAETIQGRVLFDVTPADYSLRLTDGAEVDREKLGYVGIPLKIKESSPLAPPIEGK